MNKTGLSAVVFGATGAVGSTLVRLLLASENWSRIHCVVRKQPSWQNFQNKHKLSTQVEPDLDKLFKTQEWKLQGFDNMFVAFGLQVRHGEEMFRKVDKTYPLLCADIAIQNSIPHYHLVSSLGADKKSMFLYTKVKGEVESELREKKLNMLSIYHPGLIKNRPEARLGEKIGQYICFMPAIECSELALCMMKNGEKYADIAPTASNVHKIYSNKDLLNLVK